MKINAKIAVVFCIALTLFSLAITFLFGNPRVSYDGWQYLSSAKSIQDGTFAENYFWVRQPGYPLFIDFSFSIYDSFWTLIVLQVSLFALAFNFLIWQVRSYFPRLPNRIFLLSSSLTFAFLTLFLGGYNLAVLPQSITSSFLMILTGVTLNIYRMNSLEEVSQFSKIVFLFALPLLVVIGFSISPILSYLVLTTEVFLIFNLFYLSPRNKGFLKIERVLPAKNLLLAILGLSLLSLVFVDFTWTNFSQKFIAGTSFNLNQLKDPFWGIGLQDYLSNLKRDPQLLHYIPASFFALLMLIPNTGWNGLVIEKPSSSHSQNADVGFGLFSTNYGSCVDFPGEVLAVDNEYIRRFGLTESCSLTNFDLPQFFFFPLLLIWAFLCIYWLYRIVILRDPLFLVLSTVSITYLLTYSLLGGGIDRYGSSVYPIIAIIVTLRLSSNWLDSAGKDTHQRLNR